MPVPRAYTAHPVSKIDAVHGTRPLHRPMVYREDHSVTLAQRDDLDSRLHARTLLGQNELAAREVLPWLREKERDLEREDVVTVEVLVQAVEVILAVLKQERRRTSLSCRVAAREELRMLRRISHIDPHRLVPPIGDRREARIDRGAEIGEDAGQRI